MIKPTWKISALLLAIVFTSGFAGYYFGFHVAMAKARARSNPDAWNESAMRSLDHKLKLSESQRNEIQAIMDRGVVELRGTRQETIAKTDAIIERMLAEIGTHLTPEQQAGFSSLKKKRGPTTLDLLKVEPRKRESSR